MASKRLLSPKLKKLMGTSRNQSPSRENEDRKLASETRTSDKETLGEDACCSTTHNVASVIPSDKDCVTKKRSVFFKFMSRKKSNLPKCSEVEEDPENERQFVNHDINPAVCDVSDPHLRLNRNVSPVRQPLGDNDDVSTMGATTGGRTVRLSTRLLQLVPPSADAVDEQSLGAACAFSDVDDATSQLQVVSLQPDLNSSPIGYPQVNFNRALSSSSSSASSNSSSFPNPLTDQSVVTHGLVSTIYPQIDTVRQTVGMSQASTSHTQPGHMVHTQVDYQHCLVPDLLALTNSSCYWGVMDRYEAEQLLENKLEGTFLVRDSAQEEFLFSVSFRRYGRSLHARIEQWNHCFSFDSHDLGVFYSSTVCGLIEHYKDPNCCMFFEPMLTRPLCRTSPFTLQHLCRAKVTSHITYDDINLLQLPKSLHDYLKYYHYKQRVCVRRF